MVTLLLAETKATMEAETEDTPPDRIPQEEAEAQAGPERTLPTTRTAATVGLESRAISYSVERSSTTRVEVGAEPTSMVLQARLLTAAGTATTTLAKALTE